MKKITYLVASLMLMGTTPMLTGCVDIDEPAGIEELRGAKAELLKAKASVEAAKVATEQANAAYRNAEAEYMKAQAARETAAAAVKAAEAKKVEAETEIARAEAEHKIALENAQSEIEKAKAEQALAEAKAAAAHAASMAEIEKAKAEQELAEIKAKAEQAAKEWEISYKALEANYQQLLVELAIKKSDAIDEALASYKEAVADAKDALDGKSEDLREAQKSMDKALAALNESEAQKELNTRELQKAVNTAKNDVAAAEVVLADAKEAYADAQTIEASELETKRDEKQAEVNAQIKKVADLGIAVVEYEKEYEPKEAELFNTYSAAYQAKVAIPAFSLDVPESLGLGFDGTVKSDAASYKMHDAAPVTTRSESEGNGYDNRKLGLETIIETLNDYLGENNDLWTKEAIAEYEHSKSEKEEVYKETHQLWQELAGAYASGKYNEADATKITGYEKLAADVEDYNSIVDSITNLWNKIQPLDDEKEEVEDACKKAISTAESSLDGAQVGAMKDYELAISQAYGNAVSTHNELVKDTVTAREAYDKAYEAWISEGVGSSDKAALKTALDKAKESLDNAKKKVRTVESILLESKNAAYTAYIASSEEYKKTAAVAIDKAVNTRDTAIARIHKEMAAIEAEVYALREKGDVVVDSIKGSFKTFAANANETNERKFYYVKSRWSKAVPDTVDIKAFTALNKEGLRVAVLDLSETLYGKNYKTQLVEVPEATIKAEVEKAAKKVAEEDSEDQDATNGNVAESLVYASDRFDAYQEFGLYGEILGLEYMLETQTNVINNSSKIKDLIAYVQDALDKLEADHQAAEKAIDEAYGAWNDLVVKHQENNEAATALETAKAVLEGLEEVLAKYDEAIDSYIEAGEDKKTFSAEKRAKYVAKTKAAVATAETDLYDAETALKKAEANLEAYNKDEKSAYEIANEGYEDAKVAYTAAEENYKAALEALNAKMADLSVE